MNEYDSELVRSILLNAEYTFVENEDAADIILLNTCSVRDSAVRKIHGKIHTIKHTRKESSRGVIIGILGCIPTNMGEELIKDKRLDIDFIAGPDSYKSLPNLITDAIKKHSKPFDLELSTLETYSDIYPTRESGINAWIAVTRGCNNFCSFCVVPYSRGRERSRPLKSILDETNRLTKEGFKQVTLLGQNVNSYNSDNTNFAELLNTISKTRDLRRIRFIAPHPKDFPDELIETIANNEKVCKHIHLPLQSGNSHILELMNRRYTKQQYLDLAQKIKNKIPDIVLTTDIIAGFPTETNEEFEDTLDVMKTVEFDSAFIFQYSPRKGTEAARKFEDDIPDKLKSKRTVKLNELQRKISLKRNTAHIGQTLEILIESESTKDPKYKFQGKSDGNKLVKIPPANCSIGDFVKVKIVNASPHLLIGEAI